MFSPQQDKPHYLAIERCGNNKGRGVRSWAQPRGPLIITDRNGTQCTMQCTATEHNVWQFRAPPHIFHGARALPQVPGQETLAFGRSQYIFGKWRIHRQVRQYDT